MMFYLSFLFSLILITKSNRLCINEKSKERICCNGFRWDLKEQTCLKCLVGFYGFNCSRKCRFPNYGERCQLSCACNETLCDAAYGCENQGILAENKTDSSGLNLSIIIPSVCLGASVMIFFVIFLIHKKKTSINRPNIENSGESSTAATPSDRTERVIADTSLLYNPNPFFSNEHYGYEDVFPRQSKNSRHEYDFLIPGHCFQTG